MVVVVAGEHCVDGGPCSGGRRFGQSWTSSEIAARVKLEWGLVSWWCHEPTGKSRAVEEFSPKRTLPEPEADGGGRSRTREAPGGPPSGEAGSSEVVELCGGESKLGGCYLLPARGGCRERISPASDYSGAVAGRSA